MGYKHMYTLKQESLGNNPIKERVENIMIEDNITNNNK